MARRTPLPRELVGKPFAVTGAIALGVSRERLRGRDLHAPFSGVRTTEPMLDLESRCRAFSTVMRADDHFSHVTAARLWGIPLPAAFEADPRLHVTRTRGSATVRRGLVGHETSPRLVLVQRGLALSTPADTWCELATCRLPGGRTLTRDELIVAGDRLFAWPQPLATRGEVADAMIRHTGGRGIRVLREALREVRPGSASPRESRLRLLVVRAGFPEPELNGPIRLRIGTTVHGDLVFRAYRVVLEYEGDQHRTDARQFMRDVDRVNSLNDAGWRVIRVHRGTSDATVLAWLEAGLRARGWRGVAPIAPRSSSFSSRRDS
ncbi:MAG TPA: hypothetical protein VFU07_03915 [Candidatus Lumbricidophila sp.]|nr:hypothetical protein [Candidatus Lumbricidophila sp.]